MLPLISKIKLLLVVITLIVGFSSCISTKRTVESPTLVGKFSSETPSLSATSTAKATSEPPVKRFYRIVSDADYLQDCRSQYPPLSREQIGFRDIYPGKTTSAQILERLGNPRSHEVTVDGYEEWRYYDDNLTFAYSIHTKKDVTDFVTVEVDRETLLPLKDILNKYGCPDLIIATELDSSPVAEKPNYNKTFFIYYTAGIEIRFEGYPVSYSDSASIVNFISPLPLKKYLEYKYEQGLLVDDFSSPVYLEEAVKGY